MKVFISYTFSPLDFQVASKIAEHLKASGHNVIVGDSDELKPTITWKNFSYADHWVRDQLQHSDVLIAICINDRWQVTNVGSEIAFFLGQASSDRLVILKKEATMIPLYLESPFVITYKEPIDSEFISLDSHLAIIEKRLIKRIGQIFLSYSRQDEAIAKELYTRLSEDGFKVWFDRENLSPGQDWNLEIVKSIKDSTAFVVLLSSNSVGKRGYFQKELKRSLEVAEEIPEGKIFILPVRLDDCQVPEALKKYQWCDYQNKNGYDRLSKALERLLADQTKPNN